jgi:hypothetical protein
MGTKVFTINVKEKHGVDKALMFGEADHELATMMSNTTG